MCEVIPENTDNATETDRLLQLLLNEDNLILGRTNYFLLANSFLITAFIMAFSSKTIPYRIFICTALSILGIIICFCQWMSISWTQKIWNFLSKELKNRSSIYNKKTKKEKEEPTPKWTTGTIGISRLVYPLIFGILWYLFLVFVSCI